MGFVYLIVLYNAVIELKTGISGDVIAVLVLLLLLLIIDVFSSVSFQFSTINIAAEDTNINKLIHYIATCTGIATVCLTEGYLSHLPPLIIFLALLLTKRASLCKNIRHK